MSWVMAAVASAFFAGITSILVKCGLSETDSDVATALRTLVVLVFAWAMVAVVGSGHTIAQITPQSWLFLALSGLATGGSWICYFKVVLLAIVLFGETSHLEVKLVGTAVIAVGTFMMIEKKQGASGEQSRAWLVYALLAAVFAALTSVLAKVGIEGVESNLATAIRTCFVLVMAWVIVAGKGKLSQVRHVDVRELDFLVASGVATGVSWLFFYYAISAGQVSVVVQIDKLSILVSIAFAWIVFGERLTPKSGTGLALIVAGTLAMSIWT